MTNSTNTQYDTDVAIVGAGPVGMLLAILLGQQGKKVTLVERWPEAYDRPRAVTYDHEIARILSILGIDSETDPAFENHDELYYWKDTNNENIQIVDWQSMSASGWRVRYWFNQPELEQRFRTLVGTLPSITCLNGWEGVELSQDDDGVTLGLKETETDENGARQTLRAKYVVGSDGANSFVRNSLGIKNVDKGYFFDWLILDVIPNGTYEMSPAQWQLCDPKRPTTIVPGGPGRRRWEYMVLPDENPDELAKPENAWKLLEPWNVSPENATLERSAVYRFQASWAETWHKGRCMIAGDAAHLMPPFAGEGMCAGLRDALALSWRLNAMLDGIFSDDVIASYTSERKEHAKHYINFSQELGKIICITDPDEAAERDRTMKADLAARNNEPVPTDLCHLGPGVWCDDTPAAGELSTQGVVTANGKTDRFDQVVGRGWFVIGMDVDPADEMTKEQLATLAAIGGRTIKIGAVGTQCDVEDTDGTYAKWLGSINAKYFVQRPDFYVAASASNAEGLRKRIDDVFVRLHINQSMTAN
ncbi:MAG: 3-(3-hydroxyphenyl)propionate hydroxylase [Rhodobacteraceae bacterium]|nr:MAG: 3-(3-hydroxyphenyl)propionate hydroxylase [Paracoccaceae bacterium]